MNNRNERELLVETGRELLEKNIVARTWGNTSCRVDDEHCLITPSGLDYMQTTEEDIVLLDLKSGEWEGRRKPSGERGVHIAAYRQFPGVNFVIHTHQNYATAIGLTGMDSLQITEEEKRQLGGLGAAAYGLPGMKKLTDAVDHVLQQGIQTVLMVHHGVLVCGQNKEQAMERVQLLEKICERNICAGYLQSSKRASAGAHKSEVAAKALEGFLQKEYRYAEVFRSPAVDVCLRQKKAVRAQVDDMAQMIGGKIPVAKDVSDAEHMMKKYNAVLVPDCGAVIRAETEDDLHAMKLLVDKACLCAAHTRASGKEKKLSAVDVALMHFVYLNKYSKQKEQEA